MDWVFSLVTVALLLVGIALVIYTIKRIEKGLLRNFLLTAGASLAALPIFALIHNLLYGLAIYSFGEEPCGLTGKEEILFFLLATVVCPLGFLVGTIGSAVLVFKRSADKHD